MTATKKQAAKKPSAPQPDANELLAQLVELLSAKQQPAAPELAEQRLSQVVYRPNPMMTALKAVDDAYAEIRGPIEDDKSRVRASDYELRVNRAWRNMFRNVQAWGEVPIVVTDDQSDEPASEFVRVNDAQSHPRQVA